MGTESLILIQEGAVPEKSTRNDVDYTVKPGMARHRAVLADAVLACKLTPKQDNS
jgi:hypothetical protein